MMRVSLLEINGDVLELEHMKLCRLEMHSFDSNNQLQPHVSNTVVITKAHRVGAGHRLIDDLNWSPFLLTPPPPPGLNSNSSSSTSNNNNSTTSNRTTTMQISLYAILKKESIIISSSPSSVSVGVMVSSSTTRHNADDDNADDDKGGERSVYLGEVLFSPWESLHENM